MTSPFYVTAAEITRNFGMWQDRTGQAPVIVTHHGRSRCILLSAVAYADLTRNPAPVDRETEQPFTMEVLMEEIDVAFLATDANLNIVDANTNATISLATGRNQLSGQPLATLCPDLVEGLAGIRLKRVLRTGERQRIRHAIRGRIADIHIVPSPGGLAIAWRSAEEDEALQRSSMERDALRRLLSMDSRIGTIRLSPRATIAQPDPAFCAMCGISAERLAGARLADLMSRHARTALNDAIEQVFGSVGQAHLDGTLVANDGGEIPVHIAMTAIHEEFGTGGAMIMVQDRRAN